MIQLFLLLSFFAGIVLSDTECPAVTTIGDRRTDKSKLRLVQYNVEWLFIDYYSNMDCPGNGCTWKNTSEAETHLSYVSKVIHDLNPDIINFCEIEGCDELNMLKTSLNDNTYTPYLKKGTDTSTGQNVGMLTRVDPVVSLYRTENRYDYPICAQREGQASVLQPIISDYISKGYEVILIGDLNDFDGVVLDVNSNKPTSQVLNILKGDFGEYKGKYELISVAENVKQSERYSDWYDSDNNCNTQSNKDYSMIDHVLVTSGIKNKISDVYFYHGYSEYCGSYNSDHFPVVIDLNI
jgi:exonuclease III